MSNTFSNSKLFHYVCVATMYGAHSRLLTALIIIGITIATLTVSNLIENQNIVQVIEILLGVMNGIRIVLLFVPDIRKDVCQKMNWQVQ